MHRFFLTLCFCLAASVGYAQDGKELVRKALAAMSASQEDLADYGFVRSFERKEFHSDGSVKAQRSWRARRELRDGFLIMRPIERNGKPLTEEEQQRTEQEISKSLAEQRAVPPEERRKRAEAAKKRDAEEDAWMQEVPEAFDFKITGEEVLEGRPAYVIDATPRAAYRPKNMKAKLLKKMRGRLWLDKAESEMVRADAEVFEDASLALGLVGRVAKGTRFRIDRIRVAPGIWAPSYEHARFTARIMLFKNFNAETVTRSSDYVRLRETRQARAN